MAFQGEDPANVFEIRSATDLDNLASAGVITTTVDTQLVFNMAGGVTTSNRFDATAGTLKIDSIGGPITITYIGGGTFYTASGAAAIDANEVNVIGAGTATLFDIDSPGQSEFDNCNFTAFASLGEIRANSSCALRNVLMIAWASGLTLDVSVAALSVFASVNVGTSSGPFLTIKNADPNGNDQSINVGAVGAPTTFMKIDPAIGDNVRVFLDNNAVTGTYFDVTGATGTFTAVADAAISSTSITSVTDSSGIARFNFTGPTVFVNQEVVLSGFVTNTAYNGTGIIIATDGTTFLNIEKFIQMLLLGRMKPWVHSYQTLSL